MHGSSGDINQRERSISICQSVILARNSKLDLTNKALEESPKLGNANWLIFADSTGVAEKVQSRLAQMDKQSILVKRSGLLHLVSETEFAIHPGSQKDINLAIDLVAKKGNFQGIIFLWGLDSVPNEQLDVDQIIGAEENSSVAMMNIMKYLNSTNYEKNPEIWMATSGAQSVEGIPETIQLSQAGLRGVNRVVLNEFPVFSSTMVDSVILFRRTN